jgi:hypothetical protein
MVAECVGQQFAAERIPFRDDDEAIATKSPQQA